MPWSKHYYTVVEPRQKCAGGGELEAKGDEILRLSLSLGDIYNNNNAAAAMMAKADAAAAGFLSPPMVPAPVLCAPSAAATAHPPPRFDALLAAGSGAAFFPAAGGVAPPALPQMESNSIDAVLPAPAVPAADVTPPPAPTKRRPAKRPRSVPRRPTSIVTVGDDETAEIEGGLHVCPPYPWSTDRVGVHHSLAELSRRGIDAITGELQCKRCDAVKLVTLDAKARFVDLCGYIAGNVHGMDDRAPKRWREPALPDCERCGQRGSMRPVIPGDKHRINWVFLLLSETLGMCTLEQLKHFCAHTQQHRTGAKDRVLFSTYMELCNQLLPNGLFDMESERRKRTRLNV